MTTLASVPTSLPQVQALMTRCGLHRPRRRSSFFPDRDEPDGSTRLALLASATSCNGRVKHSSAPPLLDSTTVFGSASPMVFKASDSVDPWAPKVRQHSQTLMYLVYTREEGCERGVEILIVASQSPARSERTAACGALSSWLCVYRPTPRRWPSMASSEMYATSERWSPT
ncbi:hypothetical protein I4F81_009149 [Pyropia yezoensis]|uniref:Uncharacterized protein n=1 Tax=Pyropia yezoensis TaxID=2788 RepID=A0ACC3C981_PYRYE|nr:hypothetical protein I4F81_009149 [Neopyropia yezoensis]